jgi:hypothetical protein
MLGGQGPQDVLDVASAKSVVLPTEHKPMPMPLDQMEKFESKSSGLSPEHGKACRPLFK